MCYNVSIVIFVARGGIFLHNRLISAVLVMCLAAAALCADYVFTQSLYKSRVDEQELYSSLNADPHARYNGYTVEQLGEGYKKPKEFLGKVMLDVPLINQYPELPVGCESVCAAAELQYLGFDVDKSVFAKDYLVSDNNFYYDSNHISHGPDPRLAFAGDPFSWGYGCSAGVLAKSMNSFFDDFEPTYEAISISGGINSADMEKLIDEGVPVIVWATRGMKPLDYRHPSEWIIDATGEKYVWYGNSHTLVLCGYDNECYYFMDCDDKTEITGYLKERFYNRYEENGYQSVIVKQHVKM